MPDFQVRRLGGLLDPVCQGVQPLKALRCLLVVQRLAAFLSCDDLGRFETVFQRKPRVLGIFQHPDRMRQFMAQCLRIAFIPAQPVVRNESVGAPRFRSHECVLDGPEMEPDHDDLPILIRCRPLHSGAWTEWDWNGADEEWRRALELDPGRANAHAYYAHLLAVTGHTDDALLHGKRALELDPFDALFHGLYALVLDFSRRYDEAIKEGRAGQAIDPNDQASNSALQVAFIKLGMRDEQLSLQRGRIAKDPGRVAAFERGLAEGGYEGAQRRLADLLAERYEKAGGVPNAGAARVYMPWGIALRYLDAGDYRQTINWLEKGYEDRDPNMCGIVLPVFDPLRSDPRFLSLLRRMNLP